MFTDFVKLILHYSGVFAMLNNQTYTVQLNANDVTSLIKGMSASDHYHKNLPKIHFSYPAELDEILQNNHRIKSILKDALKDTVKVYPKSSLTLCPCPPETAKPALVAVDGGILSIAKRLKEIKEEINLLNGSAFQNSTLTDAQHYQLLDVEMFIEDFIAPYSYREVVK